MKRRRLLQRQKRRADRPVAATVDGYDGGTSYCAAAEDYPGSVADQYPAYVPPWIDGYVCRSFSAATTII